MKKLIMIGITVGIASLAQANSIGNGTYNINITSSTATIHGGTAYIDEKTFTAVNLTQNQQISSAYLTFSTMSMTGQGVYSIVYYDLINGKNGTITISTGGEYNYDWFTKNGPSYTGSLDQIGSQSFSQLNTPVNNLQSPYFSTQALGDLTADLANGFVDIGLDPNCTYSIGSITLYYTVGSKSVPDTAMTAGLLGMSFLGLLAFRRKLVLQ
jgi:hypothetical protein